MDLHDDAVRLMLGVNRHNKLERSESLMKRFFVGLLLTFACGFVILTLAAARRAPMIRANVTVAGIRLGGMTVDEAARSLRVWWEEVKVHPLKLHANQVHVDLPDMRPSDLGVTLDDLSSVDRLPTQDVVSEGRTARDEAREQSFDPVFKSDALEPVQLEEILVKAVGKPRPARVLYAKGAILVQHEVSGETLDIDMMPAAVGKAIVSGQPVELPLVESPKRIPDDKLGEITDVVSSYTTHFPLRQFNRNSNIKLASSHLNGIVLMPGDELSFNRTVGQRTVKHGFKLAGVYKNGKHDTGIGGGICQVSTTLYNASLFANLTIVRRSNHSMPVAYVPLGRDATVDYGALDLVVRNDYSQPIAISSEVTPGSLTFRVLGKKDPARAVKIIQVGGKSWDTGVEIVRDPKLRPGQKVVVERGTRGHSIRSYRLIYENGVLVKKQQLGFSFYGGGDRIIAVGPSAPKPQGIAPQPPMISGTQARAPVRGFGAHE